MNAEIVQKPFTNTAIDERLDDCRFVGGIFAIIVVDHDECTIGKQRTKILEIPVDAPIGVHDEQADLFPIKRSPNLFHGGLVAGFSFDHSNDSCDAVIGEVLMKIGKDVLRGDERMLRIAATFFDGNDTPFHLFGGARQYHRSPADIAANFNDSARRCSREIPQ